jgi:hypothetical protein
MTSLIELVVMAFPLLVRRLSPTLLLTESAGLIHFFCRERQGATLMRWSFLAMILLASVTIACHQRPARADDPPDGPKRAFKDPFIENLAGEWKLTRKIRGKEETNKLKAKWVLNHQFLQLHMKDTANPPAYEAIVLIGYARADKKYVAHWCDTWGGKFSAVGYGKRSGDSIEFVFQYPDGPFYNTFTWNAKARGWKFRMENQQKDGKRTLFAEDTLRRP